MSVSYSLTLQNNSAQAWVFYVYQQLPNQAGGSAFALAWLVSPFNMAPGTKVTFQWTTDYGFVWAANGKLAPGVKFNASQYVAADLNSDNVIDFSCADNTPRFGAPSVGDRPGSLLIRSAQDVPNNTFAVGVGMSGAAIFTVQAGPNLSSVFTPTPGYWIAAGENVQAGVVLDVATINQNAAVAFPPNVYALTYALGEDNRWAQVG